MRVFDSRESLFHMVFNKSVENCHVPFTIAFLKGANWRKNCWSAAIAIRTPRAASFLSAW